MPEDVPRGYRAALSLLSGDLAEAAGLLGGPSPSQLARTLGRWRPWLRSSGIQGFGVADRSTGELRLEGERALKVYVDEKRPLARLANAAPRRLRLPGVAEALEIDVEAIGALSAHGCAALRRPALAGCSVGVVGGEAGTLGCLVRDLDTGARLVLGAGHVLAPRGRSSVGAALRQPAPVDCGRARDAIARVLRHTPLRRGAGYPNRVDAAVAELHDPSSVSRTMRVSGRRLVGVRAPKVGLRVEKVGRTSGRTRGKILDADASLRIRFSSASKPARLGFRNLVLCEYMSRGGDSGAIAIDAHGRAVGLLIAGGRQVSVFCRIDRSLASLGVELL